jgi:tetratricopeptide (TPR) repeat protein
MKIIALILLIFMPGLIYSQSKKEKLIQIKTLQDREETLLKSVTKLQADNEKLTKDYNVAKKEILQLKKYSSIPYVKGNNLRFAGKLEEAKKRYEQVIEFFPDSREAEESKKHILDISTKIENYKQADEDYQIKLKEESKIRKFECSYWKDQTDPFTNQLKKFTNSQEIGYDSEITFKGKWGGLGIELRKVGNNRFIIAKIGGIGCVGSDSYISIKLKSGVIVKIKHLGDIDCGSSAAIRTSLSNKNYSLLLSSPIEIIRVSGEHYSDVKFISKPNFFINHLKCIK